ncbi:SDR family NAD(P)-dependent oxidoreductase [Ktedonobacter racemifer]|uniref:Short-chain dehydrogenase/reductase SDR n=1 Tax=Ktedonobacter racemifer DSM 44963 TaxID=485913 RepID=D6TYT6_KTERA|nr:SDR family NAD(P)-dependent oxidoreductase [Ktedonobacter racemifer]EFH85161.1 short-chain dehydrogenase/reductase SDR [Ktedonobacter racemifer DSM 44963]
MSRVFITGSTDGLGLLAAKLLVEQGHAVVLHARNSERATSAQATLSEAEAVVIGDLASRAAMMHVAEQVNALGTFDAVIHNAGARYDEPRIETADGLEHMFAVNVLAPYILTALIARPARLIYLSSDLHRRGEPDFKDLQWMHRHWDGTQAYADSKLFDAVLAAAIARRWPNVFSNAVGPGWVPTKMGGPDAPDDMAQASATQVWLATSNEPAAHVSGKFFYHKKLSETHPAVHDVKVQNQLLAACESLSGVSLS